MTQANGDSVPAPLDTAALAGTWVLDPAKSTVRLRSKSMWGLVPVKGSFGTVSGGGSGAEVTVSGRLTVRDQTRPLSFPVTPAVHGDGEIELDAEVPVDRTDFGLTWNQLGMSGTRNTITVHAVFTRR